MKALLTLAITAFLCLPALAFAQQCRAPLMVEEFIEELETTIQDHQVRVNNRGNMCTTMVRADATLDEVLVAQVQSAANSAFGDTVEFLGNIAKPSDFMDDFLEAIPFMNRPYALNYDLERVTARMDRLWELHLRAYGLCQYDEALAMRLAWKDHFETQRLIRKATERLLNGQPNPYFIGFPADHPDYGTYSATGFYRHPSQLACTPNDFNMEQIAERIQRIGQSLDQAMKEVEHEVTQQGTKLERTWNEYQRTTNELNTRINAAATAALNPPPKITREEVAAQLQAAQGTALTAAGFLEAYEDYERTHAIATNMSIYRQEVQQVFEGDTHVSMRIQEQELEQMVRILLLLDSTLGGNLESLEQLCGAQATGIPCPSLRF